MINHAEIVERYRGAFTQLNAFLYVNNRNEDRLLLDWWITLQETNDIERLLTPDTYRLPAFYNLFAPPTVLIYSLSPQGNIDNAIWITPVDNTSKHRAGYLGLWCAPNIRGTRRQYNFARTAYSFAFEFIDAIIGLTWQPAILDTHTKMGYKIVGTLPNLYDKPIVFMVHLTKADFFSSRFYLVGERRQK